MNTGLTPLAVGDRPLETVCIQLYDTKARALCWMGIVAGCVWRALQIWRHNPIAELWSDSARNWEFGSLATRTHPLVFMDPIGYQTFLASVEKLTLGIPVLVFVVVTALSLAGPWLWYRFLREMLTSKTLALAGWACLALLPSWIGIYSYFMMETLFIPLLGLALWMTWRCNRKQDTSSFCAMAFCWMLAGLTRSVAAPMAAVVVLALWCRQPAKWAKAAYVVPGVLITLVFLGHRSQARTGIPAPLGNPYLNQCYVWSGCQEIIVDYSSPWGENYHYAFGSPVSNEQPLAPFSKWRNARSGTFAVQIALETQEHDWQQAVLRARAEGWSWSKIVRENLLYLWFGRSWPDCAPDRLAEVATQGTRWLWAPLAFVASVALARQRTLGWNAGLLLLVLGVWSVVQGLIPLAVNEGRYRKPIEGVIVAAAFLAWDRSRRASPSTVGLARPAS